MAFALDGIVAELYAVKPAEKNNSQFHYKRTKGIYQMTPKTATNQNGHVIMVIGEHVNKYLSLNKLGIIKSRSETMPEVGFKRNALR